MAVEKTSCAGCGAPIVFEKSSETAICEFCSTRNIIKHDQKGGYTAIDSRVMDFIANEAIDSKYDRLHQASQKALDEARQIKDRDLKQAEDEWKKFAFKKITKEYNRKENVFNCSGFLLLGVGLVWFIIAIIDSDFSSGFCEVPTICFIVGAILLFIAYNNNEKRAGLFQKEKRIEAKANREKTISEIRARYSKEERQWDEKLAKIKDLSSPIDSESEKINTIPYYNSETKEFNYDYKHKIFPEDFIRELIAVGKKIEALKVLRANSDYSLAESKKYVDDIEKELKL